MKKSITSSAVVIFLMSCSTPQKKEDREKMVKEFVVQSKSITTQQASRLIDSMLNEQEDSSSYRQTMELLEKPLSNPASSFRNDELYRYLLTAKLNSGYYMKEEKEYFQSRLDLISQNNVGDSANNFMYRLPGGEPRMMHDITTDFTLLFFYNPECPACKQMKAALYTDPLINGNIQLGKLTVLAVYTDRDTTLWKKHLPEMPSQWVHGRDEYEHLWKEGVYDLRAIPTVYLLDRSKRVLLKDCQDELQIGEHLK